MGRMQPSVMSGSSTSRHPRQLAHGPTVFWILYGEGAADKADRLQEILASSVDGLDRVAGAGRVHLKGTSTVLRDLDFRIVLEADSAPQNGGKSATLAG